MWKEERLVGSCVPCLIHPEDVIKNDKNIFSIRKSLPSSIALTFRLYLRCRTFHSQIYFVRVLVWVCLWMCESKLWSYIVLLFFMNRALNQCNVFVLRGKTVNKHKNIVLPSVSFDIKQIFTDTTSPLKYFIFRVEGYAFAARCRTWKKHLSRSLYVTFCRCSVATKGCFDCSGSDWFLVDFINGN